MLKPNRGLNAMLEHVTQKTHEKIFPLKLRYIKMKGKRDMIHP